MPSTPSSRTRCPTAFCEFDVLDRADGTFLGRGRADGAGGPSTCRAPRWRDALEAPPGVVRDRDRGRSSPVPDGVIDRLVRRWEMPGPTEAHRVDWLTPQAQRYQQY